MFRARLGYIIRSCLRKKQITIITKTPWKTKQTKTHHRQTEIWTHQEARQDINFVYRISWQGGSGFWRQEEAGTLHILRAGSSPSQVIRYMDHCSSADIQTELKLDKK